MKMYAGADMIKGSSKASQLLLKVKVGGGSEHFRRRFCCCGCAYDE